jgi:hypothetical protein
LTGSNESVLGQSENEYQSAGGIAKFFDLIFHFYRIFQSEICLFDMTQFSFANDWNSGEFT